jgi:hypothetical protein
MNRRRFGLLGVVIATAFSSGCSSANGPTPAPARITSNDAVTSPTSALSTSMSRASSASDVDASSASPTGTIPTTTGPAAVIVTAAKGPKISRLVLGANMAAWVDITQGDYGTSLHNASFVATRWPGGSSSDQYHWQTQTLCDGGYFNTNSTFDNFENDVAKPGRLDVAVTLNYGSNAACNGGGDPTEAAAWVAEARANEDGVKYWTVGNEVYGSWEYDLHAKPHDPATYADAVATGYYPDIKAQDPQAQVGVVAEPGANWDGTVLAQAKYDFVELHYYAQAPGSENDATLLASGPQALTSDVNALKSDLAAAGHPGTPIYVGELGSVYANPGKQSTSIVQALFAGMALSELMEDGVFRATWWLAYGGCNDASSGNFSSSLYGWQNFGGYMMFSDGTPEYGCPNATSVPRGTWLPTVRAYQLLERVAHDGEHVLHANVASGYPNVRAYAATHDGGYAITLFNLDENDTVSVPVAIDGFGRGSTIVVRTYGKTEYDYSQSGVWAAPTKATYGPFVGKPVFTLPPWSMTVAIVSP